MTQIDLLKQKSGAKAFASMFGKSTVDKEHDAYKFTEKITEVLISNGYGVLHGGYSGGIMSAVSDTANKLIAEKGLPQELNIGVPQDEHDGLWDRVDTASFVDPAEDIFARLKLVTSGDIAVVCPLGGDGTELEEMTVYHENVVREGIKKYSNKETKSPIPLIFIQIPNGTNWKKIIEAKMTYLDTSTKNIQDVSWLYFVESVDDFEKLIISLKK